MKFLSLLFFVCLIFSGNNMAQNSQTLNEGMKAPDFTLQDAYGKSYTLSSYENKSPVIVYFYPKASTPGCTKQACGIRDSWSKFEKNNIPVFGVSVDSKDAIKKFIDKYNLNFPLLSDDSKEVSKEYGVYSKLGRFDHRITFVIDKEGNIAKIIKVTDIPAHAEQVFEVASKLK